METIWTEPYWWYRFTTWIYKKARTSLTAIQWQIKRFHQALQCSCFITRLVMMSIGHLKIPTPEFCSFRFPLGTNVNMQWDTWILHFLKKTRQAYICIYYNYIIDHLQGIWLRFLVVFFPLSWGSSSSKFPVLRYRKHFIQIPVPKITESMSWFTPWFVAYGPTSKTPDRSPRHDVRDGLKGAAHVGHWWLIVPT